MGHPRFTCLPTHDQSREHCSIDADMKHFPAFGALPGSSVVGPWPSGLPINLTMLVDAQLKKESYQNAFHVVDSEVSVGQSGNQPFSPLLRRACFSHQHPAWHVVLESVDAEIEMVYITNSQI